MRILSFHLKGKMAHFRRYYSNSSSLTYSIPPRTTICGILAGILGMERDSYYEQFSLENCDIAVALKSPIKKQIFTLNLLMVINNNDLNGFQPFPSQTPTEIILPPNIRIGNLDYQIWVHHKDEKVMNALDKILGQAGYGYGSLSMPVSLGTAYHLGWIEYESVLEGHECKSNEFLDFDSVLPIKLLNDLRLETKTATALQFIREELPMEFDKARQLTTRGLGDVIISLNCKPIRARMQDYIELSDGQRIVWLQ